MGKLKFLLTVFSAILISSVSFAGVHSPPVNNESKIAKAIVNFEMPAAIVIEAVAVKETVLTPVGENSPTLYAESIASQTKNLNVGVEAVPLLYKQADEKIYDSYKQSADYTQTGYSMAFWRYC